MFLLLPHVQLVELTLFLQLQPYHIRPAFHLSLLNLRIVSQFGKFHVGVVREDAALRKIVKRNDTAQESVKALLKPQESVRALLKPQESVRALLKPHESVKALWRVKKNAGRVRVSLNQD